MDEFSVRFYLKQSAFHLLIKQLASQFRFANLCPMKHLCAIILPFSASDFWLNGLKLESSEEN